MRFMSPENFHQALLEAIEKYCEDEGHTKGKLADLIHVDRGQFYSYTNQDHDRPLDEPWHPRALIPAITLIKVCMAMDDFTSLQELCELADRFLAKHPKVDPKDALSVFKQLEQLHETTVKLSETLRSAWSDNRITRAELNAIVLAATKNQAACQEIIEWAMEMRKLGEKDA